MLLFMSFTNYLRGHFINFVEAIAQTDARKHFLLQNIENSRLITFHLLTDRFVGYGYQTTSLLVLGCPNRDDGDQRGIPHEEGAEMRAWLPVDKIKKADDNEGDQAYKGKDKPNVRLLCDFGGR